MHAGFKNAVVPGDVHPDEACTPNQGPATTWRAHLMALHIAGGRYGGRWTGGAAGGGTGHTPRRRQRITVRVRPQERGRRGWRTSRLQSNAATTAPHHAEPIPLPTASPTYNPSGTWKKLGWSHPPTFASNIHPAPEPNTNPPWTNPISYRRFQNLQLVYKLTK